MKGDYGFDGEITDAMVRAGLAELWPCELRLFQNEAEVMARVYRAMVRLSPDFPLEDDPDEQLGKTGDRPVR